MWSSETHNKGLSISHLVPCDAYFKGNAAPLSTNNMFLSGNIYSSDILFERNNHIVFLITS